MWVLFLLSQARWMCHRVVLLLYGVECCVVSMLRQMRVQACTCIPSQHLDFQPYAGKHGALCFITVI